MITLEDAFKKFPISKEDREVIKCYTWVIAEINDYKSNIFKCEISEELSSIEYVLTPLIFDSEVVEEVELGYRISVNVLPFFVMALNTISADFRKFETEWCDAVDKMKSMIEDYNQRKVVNHKLQNLIEHIDFFKKIVDEDAKKVLNVESDVDLIMNDYSSFLNFASELSSAGDYSHGTIERSIFHQAFVTNNSISEKQVGVIKKSLEAPKTNPASAPEYKNIINDLFLELSICRLGRSNDFFESLKLQWETKMFLSDKQCFHLEKLHYRFRNQHNFKLVKEANYKFFKV